MTASANRTDTALETLVDGGPGASQRVWDAPVRLCHWALVVLLGVAWWTGERRMLEWHRLAGYSILALILFRLAWGFVGSSTARFGEFVRGPAAVAAYVKSHLLRTDGPSTTPGHNPLGGWSVVVMLGALVGQLFLGLVSVDVDGLESGPFAHLVSFETGRRAAELHHLLFNLILSLIAIHLAAVGYYLAARGTNLISPMITGWRRWTGPAPHLRFASRLRAILLAALCGAAVWALVAIFGRV